MKYSKKNSMRSQVNTTIEEKWLLLETEIDRITGDVAEQQERRRNPDTVTDKQWFGDNEEDDIDLEFDSEDECFFDDIDILI